MRRSLILAVAALVALLTAIPSNAAGGDVRLTHDEGSPGKGSDYSARDERPQTSRGLRYRQCARC